MRSLWSTFGRVATGRAARRAAVTLSALLVFGVVQLPSLRMLWLVLVCVVAAGIAWLAPALGDRLAVSQVLLLASIPLSPQAVGLTVSPWTLCAVLATVVAVTVDPFLAPRCTPDADARYLPGFRTPGRLTSAGAFLYPTVVATVLLALSAIWPQADVVTAIIALLVLAAGSGVGLADALAKRRGTWNRRLRAAVEAYEPAFFVYYSGPREGGYQLSMWLPYLEQLGRPFAILVREEANVALAAEVSSRPVLFIRRLEAMPMVLTDSVTTVFYVNNEIKNAQGVRFLDVTHVHLGHGDSDKPPSYSPTTGMFDLIFVAGQAGVDRFAAHGVSIPAEKFRLVGRPQLAQVQRAGEAAAPSAHTVLYAPTWRGGLPDMTFGSLAFGYELVDALLRLGTRVIFRPHPYSSRDAASRVQIQRINDLLRAHPGNHLTSEAAESMSVFECFNASSALVSDISSIASDYLSSGKPFALTDTGVSANLADEFPLAACAYILRAGTDHEPVLSEMLGSDPLRPDRRRMGTYYLGDTSDRDPVDFFVAAARAALARG